MMRVHPFASVALAVAMLGLLVPFHNLLGDSALDSDGDSGPEGELPLRCSSTSTPGGSILVTVAADSGWVLTDASLVVSERVVSGPNPAFRVTGPNGPDVWVSLIGVPSTTADGPAIVRVRNKHGAELTEHRLTIAIEPREFRSVEIALDGAMSDLRSSDHPRKARESRELWSLLNTINLDGVHDVEAFTVPLRNPRTSSVYGERRLFAYADGSSDRTIHTGLDFAAPRGTIVFAPADGRVAFAAARMLTGNTIVLEHLPGVYSLYYHLDRIDVSEGEIVRRSSILGTVGATGLVTGAHLHWELRIVGVPVEPQDFLDRSLVDMLRE